MSLALALTLTLALALALALAPAPALALALSPTRCDGCRHAAEPAAREGYAMLWVHLPAVYGAKFEPFLPDVLPLVLLGLADDAEPVR